MLIYGTFLVWRHCLYIINKVILRFIEKYCIFIGRPAGYISGFILDWKQMSTVDWSMTRGYIQGRQENIWAPGQKETCPPSSSNSLNNDTQTKSTTVCHKQGIGTTKMNWRIVI